MSILATVATATATSAAQKLLDSITEQRRFAASFANKSGETLTLAGEFFAAGMFTQSPPRRLKSGETLIFGGRSNTLLGPEVRGCAYFQSASRDILIYYSAPFIGRNHAGIFVGSRGAFNTFNWVKRGQLMKTARAVSVNLVTRNFRGLEHSSVPGDLMRFELG